MYNLRFRPKTFQYCPKMRKTRNRGNSCEFFLQTSYVLSYPDSNQDKDDQNVLCCHYTIRQYSFLNPLRHTYPEGHAKIDKLYYSAISR